MDVTLSSSAPPRPVVVGTDGTPGSDAALSWAAAYARTTDAELQVLCAWQDQEALHWTPSPVAVPLLPGVAAAAAQVGLDDSLVRTGLANEDATVSPRIVQGPAALVLEKAAREASLVVVGRRHRLLGRLLVGSVSTALLHHAPRPVVVVPHDLPEPAAGPGRVVVGYDHAPHTGSALRLAVDLALRFDVPLCVVSVRARFADALLESPAAVEEYEQLEQEAVHEAVSELDADARLKVFVVTAVGRAADVLVSTATTTDVLVLGARPRAGLSGFVLGSTSAHAAHTAHCPVVVAR